MSLSVMGTMKGKSLFLSNPQLTIVDFERAIAQSAIFGVLSPPERKTLLKSAAKRTYKMSEEICREGEYGHSLFLLVSGSVELGGFTYDASSGRQVWGMEQELTQSGESFGEESLIASGTRIYTVVATSHLTAVLEVDLPLFSRLNQLSNGKLDQEISALQREVLVISTLSRSEHLSLLSEEGRNVLAKMSHLKRLSLGEKGSVRNGQVTFIISGLLEVKSVDPDGKETSLLFLNDRDLFLSKEDRTQLIFIAKESTSYVILSEEGWRLLSPYDRDLINRNARHSLHTEAFQSNTVFSLVKEVIDDGAQHALSLLSIDLDLCVRCGQCTRACQDRHGHARMTRQGQTLKRRKELTVKGDYQSILLPSSCRHCEVPECMVGCPTSAISRAVGGEVKINDDCIGCGSCANRCPYGNITMVPTETAKREGAPALRANKCDLCSGYDQPNCVNNCPTGAMSRIQPQQYFEEFAVILGSVHGQVAGGEKTEARVAEHRRKLNTPSTILTLMTIAITALGWWVSRSAPESRWSAPRLIFGGLTLLMMVLAALLGMRRRRAKSRSQFGRLYTWTQAHLAFGALSLVFMIYHTNGHAGIGITKGLWYLTWTEVALGVFGWLLYKWLPQILTRLETGGFQLEEQAEQTIDDVMQKFSLHQSEIAEVRAAQGAPPSLLKILFFPNLVSRWQKRCEAHPKDMIGGLSLSWSRLVVQVKMAKAYRILHSFRRGWLIAHLGISAALIVIIVAHVVSVFRVL